MLICAKVKLLADDAQRAALIETIERVNLACEFVSEIAWQAQEFRRYSIQVLAYRALREEFGLPSQIAVRCIAKVADAYKLDKKTKRTFLRHGSIAYDRRILAWNLDAATVSIRSLHARLSIRFAAGGRQEFVLPMGHGRESGLIFQHGNFYLAATCDMPEPAVLEAAAFLGVDLGIANIASDSDGHQHSGSQLKCGFAQNMKLSTSLFQGLTALQPPYCESFRRHKLKFSPQNLRKR
jgi:putative transposase